MKDYNWFTIPYIEKQEEDVVSEFSRFFGKSKGGFCDNALKGCELILQAICHLTNMWELNEKGNFKNFDNAFRCFAFYHYERIFYTFKACYNLLISGYYTESAILLRNIVETFIRLKYVQKQKSEELIFQALAGRHQVNGKKIKVTYREQFDKISPGYYEFYRLLCDMSHGGMASHMLKVTPNTSTKEIIPDDGIIFKPHQASFIMNQYIVYLLGHLNYLYSVFPEIIEKMPDFYKVNLTETVNWLNNILKEFKKNEKNKIWIEKALGIINV